LNTVKPGKKIVVRPSLNLSFLIISWRKKSKEGIEKKGSIHWNDISESFVNLLLLEYSTFYLYLYLSKSNTKLTTVHILDTDLPSSVEKLFTLCIGVEHKMY